MSRSTEALADGLFALPQHGPVSYRGPGDLVFMHHLKTEPLIQGHIVRVMGIQVAGQALLIQSIQ